MAAISFQLATLFQETVTEAPAQQAATNTPPVNPNQAQGAPVPQDTVTLTGQASQGQQAQQNQQQPAFQESIFFVAEAQVQVFAQGNGDANTGAQQTPEAPPTPQVPTSTQPQDATALLATGTTANNGNAGTAVPASEQELQQLDQTLQQLGINPQSISLFNRLALLLYANNPAALQQFIQQLQQGVQEIGEGNGATATVANQNSTQGQNPAQPQNQATAAAQGGTSGAAATATPVNQAQGQTNAASSIFLQFEELQITFGTDGGQAQSSLNNGAGSSNSSLQGSSQLNVTA